MNTFEALSLSLHGCAPGHPLLHKRNSPCRADEQRESVSGAKPHNSAGKRNWTLVKRREAGRGRNAEHHFCVVVLSMGQDAPMRMEQALDS